MCEFLTIATALGTLTTLVTGLQGAKLQSAQADYARQSAAAAERQAAWELNRRFENDTMALGNLQAQQAASGVASSGSKADFLLSASFGQAVDRDRQRLQGEQRATSLQAESAFGRSRATSLLVQAGLDTATSGMSGLAELKRQKKI